MFGGILKKFGTESYGISGTFCAFAFACANAGAAAITSDRTPSAMWRFMSALRRWNSKTVGASAQPGGEVLVPDGDPRTAGVDMAEPADEPRPDGIGLAGRDRRRRVGPSLDQPPLQLARGRINDPVASRASHRVAGRDERVLRRAGAVGPGRASEPFVVLPLVTIHQRAHLVVLRLRRVAP